MMNPKFSIIIPVYNVAPYLRECLDSVSAQTFTDWEAICVDDGSTDGSGTILDEYAARDSRFRVIHQKNAGVCAARNVALDFAIGEYVEFIDGDDAIAPCLLEVMMEAIAKYNDPDFVFHGVECVAAKDGKLPVVSCDRRGDMRFWEDKTSCAIGRAEQLTQFSGACSGAYKRAVLEGVRYKSGVVQREDGLFHCELLPRLTTMVDIAYPGYSYRYSRSGNASSKRSLARSFGFYNGMLALAEGFLGELTKREPLVRKYIATLILKDFQWGLFDGLRLNVDEKRLCREYLARLNEKGWVSRASMYYAAQADVFFIVHLGWYWIIPIVEFIRRICLSARRRFRFK